MKETQQQVSGSHSATRNARLTFCLAAFLVMTAVMTKNAAAAPEGNVHAILKENSGYQHLVTGKVKDTSGAPISGATVEISGTKKGTVTDASGRYSIEAQDGQTLIFRFVGYIEQRRQIHGSQLDIILEPPVRARWSA